MNAVEMSCTFLPRRQNRSVLHKLQNLATLRFGSPNSNGAAARTHYMRARSVFPRGSALYIDLKCSGGACASKRRRSDAEKGNEVRSTPYLLRPGVYDAAIQQVRSSRFPSVQGKLAREPVQYSSRCSTRYWRN